jgi:hypothetical protein
MKIVSFFFPPEKLKKASREDLNVFLERGAERRTINKANRKSCGVWRCDMAEVERISPAETREKVKSGQGLLVCGYSDAERCKNYPIEGAISFQEFESRVPAIPKNQETIFYCD